MLNATWLETFATLCDVGHFTRAAAALNMTQPGVSQHVKKLEAQIGQPLLTRDGKSFSLTPAGETVLIIARRRRAEDAALQGELQTDDPDRGQVSIACSGSLALLLYPRFMDVMAEAPGLSIVLEAMPQARILEGVIAGHVDLGIVDHSPTHPRLQGESVGQDELCLLVPPDRMPPQSFAELDTLGFIAHPDGLAYADELLGANFPDAHPGADRLRRRSFINQIGQIPEPVLRGIGYTILPRSGVDAHPWRHRLQVMQLPKPVRHDLWLIQRRNRCLPARARRIHAEITGVIAGLGRQG
ncbi:LysR family transcriptional regulator [Maritimibacter alkaliphilus]|uniref:LysR family transcriptional regulator n=1 Tax=Maritimibacter alkaliphilus TaxID=404236 RepID=UPI001C98C400|nr:LysR family transcriptional regulator [Maritimibacter alkaliphilus]MBY6093109.1 LysR family transcriptional regulator [Maritimibacter alkaliphilus]